MTHGWEPGTQYNLGDVVEYEGNQYKIIQAHRSQGDWTPPVTPALWGKIPKYKQSGDCKPKPAHQQPQHHGSGGYQQPQQPSYDQQPQQQPPSYGQPQQPGGQQTPWTEKTDQHVEIKPEEREKKWYELDDDRKKQLAIGGGLAAGLGLLGAGFAVYKHHEHEEEEEEQKKAHLWEAQNWIHAAQKRTQEFYQNGPRAPTTWVLVQGTQIPQGAILGGDDNGQPLYIARTYHEGSIQVGKAGVHCRKGAVIGFRWKEVDSDTYEILVGDSRAIKWVDVRGKFTLGALGGCRPVEGGHEADGTTLYVAQGLDKGETHCGKVSEKMSCALLPIDGKEVEVKNYRVLVYA